MSHLYSRATGGFYDPEINQNIPTDAIPVSDELYSTLFGPPNYGCNIGTDENGNPAIIIPVPTPEQVHAALQASAQAALDKSDITVIRCYSAGVATPSAWETYRAALRAIVNGSDTTSTSLPSVPTYPSGT